jgi:SAM-dependent methyltransferase
VLAADPSYAPTLALLDEATAIYPRVARGETSGERALFQKVSLWPAYFDNRNGYYALTNRVAARAAARRLPASGARVLEVGAGLGSATAALLAEIAGQTALSSYRVTEPVPFFRRRAERTLPASHPGVALAFADLDLNRPWGSQGITPGGTDLVWGVNVFHLARDLDVTLREAYAALAPGAWLVIGEGIRPTPRTPVGAEFPFQLLERFADVVLDPHTRPTPGFLTAEHWLAALGRAGFTEAAMVPDVVRLRPFNPGFLAAAACGRRP